MGCKFILFKSQSTTACQQASQAQSILGASSCSTWSLQGAPLDWLLAWLLCSPLGSPLGTLLLGSFQSSLVVSLLFSQVPQHKRWKLITFNKDRIAGPRIRYE